LVKEKEQNEQELLEHKKQYENLQDEIEDLRKES
jgi:hypothetical protein